MNRTAVVLLTLGACAVVAGVALWSAAAALIVGGLLLMCGGYLSTEAPAPATPVKDAR